MPMKTDNLAIPVLLKTAKELNGVICGRNLNWKSTFEEINQQK